MTPPLTREHIARIPKFYELKDKDDGSQWELDLEALCQLALRGLAAEGLIEALETTSKQLDAIKYELCASVYTLEDGEFGKVFDVRDVADEALLKFKKETGE